jgi:hypothetical protein
MRYELIQYETNEYGEDTGNKISTSFHADTLDQVIERMQYFLKGSGFIFDGQLDIVSEDNSDLETFKINLDNDSDIIMGGGGPSSEHSPYYYDKDRNHPSPFSSGSSDWDNYSEYVNKGPFNLDANGDFEIKLDSSNIYFDYHNTMAGYPHER